MDAIPLFWLPHHACCHSVIRPAGLGALSHRPCPMIFAPGPRPTLPSPSPPYPTASPGTPPRPSQADPCPGPACILPSRPQSLGGTGLNGRCIHTAHNGRGRAHSQCVCSPGRSPGQGERKVGLHPQCSPIQSQETQNPTPSIPSRHLDSHWLWEKKSQAQPSTPSPSLSRPLPRLLLHFTLQSWMLSQLILASPAT